jgi:hypothetical protein
MPLDRKIGLLVQNGWVRTSGIQLKEGVKEGANDGSNEGVKNGASDGVSDGVSDGAIEAMSVGVRVGVGGWEDLDRRHRMDFDFGGLLRVCEIR